MEKFKLGGFYQFHGASAASWMRGGVAVQFRHTEIFMIPFLECLDQLFLVTNQVKNKY
jgi:hypothetical protein